MLFLIVKVRSDLKIISSTRMSFLVINDHPPKSDAWKRRGRDFSDEKLILFDGPATPFDLIALLLALPIAGIICCGRDLGCYGLD